MSVFGEFQRLAAECIGLLHASGARGAADWAGALEKARGSASDDLEQAATRVLDLFGDGGSGLAPSFESDLEREDFEDRRRHLAEICRVIVGR